MRYNRGRRRSFVKTRKENDVKKRQAALALSLLSAVSALCLKGMKMVGEKLSRKENTFADIDLRKPDGSDYEENEE